MRIAYYGLSSPIFYDYKFPAPTTKHDLNSSPNPILDSAFGTIILFDELWFFCESLCPSNLRGLPYVKYLDNVINTELLGLITTKHLQSEFGDQNQFTMRGESMRSVFQNYTDIVSKVGVNWKAAADNHTHSLLVGGNKYHGSSFSVDNILFDLATIEYLQQKTEKDVYLITNSFTQTWLDSPDSVLAKANLTEHLILKNIPNYLIKQGPYHKCIEEVRENEYLKYFRNWISAKKLRYDSVEIAEAQSEIENVLEESQKKIFLKYLDPKSTFKSLGKTIAGAVVDNIIPYVSTVYSVAEDLQCREEKKEMMWQGFIISAKQ